MTEAAEETPEEASAEDGEEASSEEGEEASSASAVPEQMHSEEPTEAPTAATEPPVTTPPETVPAETMAEETVPAETEPVLINGKPLEFYQVNRTSFHDSSTGERTDAKYVYLPINGHFMRLSS